MDAETRTHTHRCMRCGNEFVCQTPNLCAAKYDVLPSIVRVVAGQVEITDHCEKDASGAWAPRPEFPVPAVAPETPTREPEKCVVCGHSERAGFWHGPFTHEFTPAVAAPASETPEREAMCECGSFASAAVHNLAHWPGYHTLRAMDADAPNWPRWIGLATTGDSEAADKLQAYIAALRSTVSTLRAERVAVMLPRPFAEWHEDFGAALWWQWEICQPPYAGTPLDTDWPFSDDDEADGSLWWTPSEPIAKAVDAHVRAHPSPGASER